MLLLVIGTLSYTGHLDMGNAVGTEHTIINQKAENVVDIKRKSGWSCIIHFLKTFLTSHLIFQLGYDSRLRFEGSYVRTTPLLSNISCFPHP